MDAVSFRHLPPQQLNDGVGTLRDVWTDIGAGQDLRWLLRLVELRGAHGKTYAPAGTEQLIIGLSGPQVRIGAGRGAPLRRDRALTQDAALIEMHRPLEGVGGTSRLLVLAFDPLLVSAQASFGDLDGEAAVAANTEALVVLKGHVEHAGGHFDPGSVAILHPPVVGAFHAQRARVLTLQFTDTHAAPTRAEHIAAPTP